MSQYLSQILYLKETVLVDWWTGLLLNHIAVKFNTELRNYLQATKLIQNVYTTRQRNFTLYVSGIIFTCKYFKFGLNTTGLMANHILEICQPVV